MATTRLTDEQVQHLAAAWRHLQQATKTHAVVCECVLCQARGICLIEDEEDRQIESVIWPK